MIELFHTRCDAEEIEIAARVMRSGKFVMGEHVAGIEVELSHYLRGMPIVTCGSGTDALILALEAVTLKPNEQVIVPAMTFSATYEAVLQAGALPMLADVDPVHLTPTRKQILAAATDRTAAVIIVHLHGWVAPEIEAIREYCEDCGWYLIEDCAQAFGARLNGDIAGTFGDAAAFSFYPTKPLGGIDDGGAVAFRSRFAAQYAAKRRNHGRNRSGAQETPGYNSRLGEINAAILRHRLAKYETTRAHLKALAAVYGLHGDAAPYVAALRSHVRDDLRAYLATKQIATGVHYDPAVSGLPYSPRRCDNADTAAKELLSLPCHRAMSLADAVRVVEALATFGERAA